MKRYGILLTVICCMLPLISGCMPRVSPELAGEHPTSEIVLNSQLPMNGDETQIRQLFERFEQAVNSLSVSELLACLDPRVSIPAYAILAAGETILEIDEGMLLEIIDAIPILAEVYCLDIGNSPTVDIAVLSVDVQGNSASAYTQWSDEEGENTFENIPLRRIENYWYIEVDVY